MMVFLHSSPHLIFSQRALREPYKGVFNHVASKAINHPVSYLNMLQRVFVYLYESVEVCLGRTVYIH